MPRFLHGLTAIHALGAVACFVMAIGSAISTDFRSSLAVSGGSALMLALFGEQTWAFLLFVGTVLAVLAYSSWRIRWWACLTLDQRRCKSEQKSEYGPDNNPAVNTSLAERQYPCAALQRFTWIPEEQ
jgi:hypothetical protein